MTTIIRSAFNSMASLGFLKFLKNEQFEVIGTDLTTQGVGSFLVDRSYDVPKANKENEQLIINRYNEIIDKTSSKWIISGPENEIEILIKNRNKFNAQIFHLPHETFLKVSDKKHLFLAMSKLKIKTPLLYDNLDDIKNLNPNSKIVIKPRNGRGSFGVEILEIKEILKKYHSIPDGYILQEYIRGIEISIDTLHNFKGNLLNAIPRLRISIESGISVVSQTFNDDTLIEIIKKISTSLPFYGFNCFQFIKDDRGYYYITDVNPRFGGGAILSLASSLQMKKNFISLINDEDIDNFNNDYKILKMYRGYEEFYE